MLELAVKAFNASVQSSASRGFETITKLQASQMNARTLPKETAFFVSVPERDLSRRQGLAQTRVACDSLRVAQALVRSGTQVRVVLVAQAGSTQISGIETAAALLAGMSGLIDDRLLLEDDILRLLLTTKHLNQNNAVMVVAGEPARRLRRAKALLDTWGLDDEGDEVIDLKCFRSAMALAQLDRLRPLRGHGDPYSFVKLADALNIAEPQTSFRLSPGDLRKALSVLAARLLGSDHDRVERLRLPESARAQEFPLNLPVIASIPEKEMSKRLYSVCYSLEISRLREAGDRELWAVKLPLTHLRHLSSRRRITQGD